MFPHYRRRCTKGVIGAVFLFCFLAIGIALYNVASNDTIPAQNSHNSGFLVQNHDQDRTNNNIWLIFTRVISENNKPALQNKFYRFLVNILNMSSIPLTFHIVVDKESAVIAATEISNVVTHYKKSIMYRFYDMEMCEKAIADIVAVMGPHFSSKAGSYYSHSLFYLSLGLHRISDRQQRAIMLDLDIWFKNDVAMLFQQFDRFKKTAIFGLAPELSPVYRHVLHMYKTKIKTTFGESYKNSIKSADPVHPLGYQGYNSGVILLKLNAIRQSSEYANALQNETVIGLTEKYAFKGHLGDQDFYTLLGYEFPHLIQTLHCGFNRQLCTWWRDHGGYANVFSEYFKCSHKTIILHGNCNTIINRHRRIIRPSTVVNASTT